MRSYINNLGLKAFVIGTRDEEVFGRRMFWIMLPRNREFFAESNMLL